MSDQSQILFETLPEMARRVRDEMTLAVGGTLFTRMPVRLLTGRMRGEPTPQPAWTIDTYAEEIERGKYISANKVEGGYARYRANLFDEAGRLIFHRDQDRVVGAIHGFRRESGDGCYCTCPCRRRIRHRSSSGPR